LGLKSLHQTTKGRGLCPRPLKVRRRLPGFSLASLPGSQQVPKIHFKWTFGKSKTEKSISNGFFRILVDVVGDHRGDRATLIFK